MKQICFFDLETEEKHQKILDIGGTKWDGETFHKVSIQNFLEFIGPSSFLCGHNIVKHDIPALEKAEPGAITGRYKIIDTLYLSPLLFPSRPYHKLLKDDKLQVDELNNHLNDAIKARDLFFDEVNAFRQLDAQLADIFYWLLHWHPAFKGFFEFLDFLPTVQEDQLPSLIQQRFEGSICSNTAIAQLIENNPLALAYALALIKSTDRYSITPPWVLHQFPDTTNVMHILRGKPCLPGCNYCNSTLNPKPYLLQHFGYSSFRTYGGEPLQEKAVHAAINYRSLLAVFPTGGGKSLTFQIPALMAGEHSKALTVIISPLQSLMKDQVDNLEKRGITEAVTINGLLDPIERSKSIERVQDGGANLLYISPESLRSITIEKLLLGRNIARFVIDEAHCFSAWGQDFRVDYLYIGDFIRHLQEKKQLKEKIPVSCFTATAKQKVIEDIREYFRQKLGLELELFTANASRTNLRYKVYNKDDENEKYEEVRRLLELKQCPSIIYVSRTKKAYKLAERLCEDGFNARPYHGKMDKEEKTENQNAFIQGTVDIMVATSAFGMGVDKSDVGMVIHYEISDSLENYIQEAGRAGRDEAITADCYILFNEDDLDKHFLLLNQTRIDIKEINQIWKAIKTLTRTRDRASNSALEIARTAGWEESTSDIETRVTTAIAALEEAGYLKRGQNMPRVYATGILSKNAQEAVERINASTLIPEHQQEKAIRIIRKLLSSKSRKSASDDDAESRVDYISDQLGIRKDEVIEIVQLLRDEKILADTKDLTAFIRRGENSNRSAQILDRYRQLENFLHQSLTEHPDTVNPVYNLKELNEKAVVAGCSDASPNKLKTLINFWTVKNWIRRRNLEHSKNHVQISTTQQVEWLRDKMQTRHFLCKIIVDFLYARATTIPQVPDREEVLVEFSVIELKEHAKQADQLFKKDYSNEDIEDSLFFLGRIEAIKIEGGFLVTHNRLTIDRIEKNNRIWYKESDYEKLRKFYDNKVQQIHIVGEYAKKMIQNYNDALTFVDDYFRLNYTSFLGKYFPGSKQDDIHRPLTPAKFRQLFGELSPAQLEIIKDSVNQYILIAAGPGSGKTRVLVHKLASLLLTEDVKHEQLLMLTFSRAAATEFKKRLIELIGNAAHYIEIKTFHSYCFDLLGKMGSLVESNTVLEKAIEKIRNGDIEASRITKTVLVVDEAQDINEKEYALLESLMAFNEDMRVILVGDDDQNIYAFRGSDSKYMLEFLQKYGAKKYELVENYRSKQNIVTVANLWSSRIANRIKQVPIFSHDRSDGQIRVVEHVSRNLMYPLVRSLRETPVTGSVAVLTRTNEEAVQLTGLLHRGGLPAKLIQSNDGFNLYNLQELRYMSGLVETDSLSPTIADEEWDQAVRDLKREYGGSDKLELCMNLVRDFEEINVKRKYKSDWKSFLMESRLEDFIRINTEIIYVSTMHKAKGREFDNVFLLLEGFNTASEEDKRLLYVAMTRARKNLTVHYHGQYLRNMVANELNYGFDNSSYDPVSDMSLQLTHRDVQLWHFERVQHRMQGLVSGNSLFADPGGLAGPSGLVVKYSAAFNKRLQELFSKGYAFKSAKANYIVFWVDTNSGKESKIVLPELVLGRG